MDKTKLQKELDKINREWQEVTDRRKKWMDENMIHFAKYKIGEELFDLGTGESIGIVSKLYRYHGHQNDPRYDRSMSIEYELSTGGNCFDNTSRRGNPYSYGNKSELVNRK